MNKNYRKKNFVRLKRNLCIFCIIKKNRKSGVYVAHSFAKFLIVYNFKPDSRIFLTFYLGKY